MAASLALLLLLVFGTPGRWLGARPQTPSQWQGEKPIELDWYRLEALDVRTAVVPPSLREVDGALVRLPGYLVPIEDDLRRSAEFLMVPYFGACVHVPPPPENQMVYVRMAEGKEIDLFSNGWDPVWIIGYLHVEPIESPYGRVGYHLDGLSSEPYEIQ